MKELLKKRILQNSSFGREEKKIFIEAFTDNVNAVGIRHLTERFSFRKYYEKVRLVQVYSLTLFFKYVIPTVLIHFGVFFFIR